MPITCYNTHIPLPQAIYALILMRRHMWLFAEYQASSKQPSISGMPWKARAA